MFSWLSFGFTLIAFKKLKQRRHLNWTIAVSFVDGLSFDTVFVITSAYCA